MFWNHNLLLQGTMFRLSHRPLSEIVEAVEKVPKQIFG